MRKKGQDYSVLKYVFIAIIFILLQVMAYKSIKATHDAACKSELISFTEEIKRIGKSLSYGSTVHETIKVPCKSEELYFVDNEKLLKSNLDMGAPLIQDSVESGISDNVFLKKKNLLKEAFETEREIEIGYPHYLCLNPDDGEVPLTLSVSTGKLSITSECGKNDCTKIPIAPGEREAKDTIEEFVEYGYSGECDSCPKDADTEYENYVESTKDADVSRSFSSCIGKKYTKVRIIIRPKEKLKDYYFYEQIPKECISSLNAYLAESIDGDVTIKDDPLIMWHFDEIKEETEVSYKLKKALSDECKKMFKGLGLERLKEGARQSRSCSGTDTSCGTYPDCIDCNSLDGLTGSMYCSNNNVVRDFADYSCNSNQCVKSSSIKTIKSCGEGQTCQGTACADEAPACTSHSSFKCAGNDIYWFDSCNQAEEVKEQCSHGCTNNACNPPPEPALPTAPEPTTCQELGGSICSDSQYCDGSQITAPDSDKCCSGTCKAVTCTTCNSCGDGLFNVCDSAECGSCGNCYFTDNLMANSCDACPSTCDGYGSDQSLCSDNPCGLSNCAWDGNSCTTTPTCTDECSTAGQKQCSASYSQTCDDYNSDGCFEWNTGTLCEFGCSAGECNACTPSCMSWPSECSQSMSDGCGSTCTRNTEGDTCQSGSGVCKSGTCCIPSTWTPSPSTICSGDSFTQVSNCETTRTSTGTKSCGSVGSGGSI